MKAFDTLKTWTSEFIDIAMLFIAVGVDPLIQL